MSERNINLSIIACGGAGINILRKYWESYGGDCKYASPNRVRQVAIDTSTSNLAKAEFPHRPAGTDLEDGCIEVEEFVIGENGAGKNRASILKDIQYKLDKSKVYDTFGDINIFIFSMSGGSGSVIAPLLIREAGKRGKRIIAIGIVDACSETDCFNSINTIRTLESFAKSEKIYIPSLIFSNINVGRIKVNMSIISRLNQLEGLFVTPEIAEVDFTDKMNFLSPVGIVPSISYGLYNMSIKAIDPATGESYSLPGEDEINASELASTPVHATFSVSEDGLAPDIITGVLYLGIVEDVNKTNPFFSLPFTINTGLAISSELIDTLNAKEARFERANSFKAKSDVSDKLQAKDGEESSTGIIS